MRLILKYSLFALIYILFVNDLLYGAARKDYIETIRKMHRKDSVDYINVLRDLKWEALKTGPGGINIQIVKPDEDSIVVRNSEIYRFTCRFKVNPALLNRVYSFAYDIRGSGLLQLNGKNILQTGYFASPPDSGYKRIRKDGYVEFVFMDTIQEIDFYLLPDCYGKGELNHLLICQISYRDKSIKEEKKVLLRSFFTGSFHIAFGVIFIIIFLFSRGGLENLYFALYALLVGVYFVFSELNLNGFWDMLIFLTWLPALEILSVFLCRIVLHKKKSLLILAVLSVFVLGCSLYNWQNNIFDTDLNSIYFVWFLILIFGFEIISLLFFLIQGFFQKSWEAKTIAYGFMVSVLFFILLIVYATILSFSRNFEFAEVVVYFPLLALVSILVTMSIVLGRKNRENQDKLLAQLNRIETLSAENMEREKEKQQILENQKEELESKVVERTAEVIHQKQIIETKNTEITDNLIYARRIQSAMLPDLHSARKSFRQLCVCYIPRDIVSGDFYSFIQKGDKVMFAAADCTGHGVSGAFMSMIGSSLLNQVINERNIYKPAEILEHLNLEIVSSLKQHSSDSNDGMDIAMCCLDLKSGVLEFAGANRPLWLVRNNALSEYKPDKFPIGGMQYVHPGKYTCYTVPLQEGDSVYLTTDGYADQFGGGRGKKMMSQKLKEVIISIQHLTMEEQELYLHKFFEEWKGANEQVDDVLVIGVRV